MQKRKLVEIYSLASRLHAAQWELSFTAACLEEGEKQLDLYSCLSQPNSESESEFVQLLDEAEEEALALADRVEELEYSLQQAITAVGSTYNT